MPPGWCCLELEGFSEAGPGYERVEAGDVLNDASHEVGRDVRCDWDRA